MFETPLTVIGNIVTNPDRRRVGDQDVIRFRVASNSRRRTADGTWEAGNSLFITVNCWGRLVSGVGAALYKGAPVIVHGHVYTSEYEDREGIRRSSQEMRAISVGPDLARCIVRIEATGSNGGTSDTAATSDKTDATEADDGDKSDDAADDAEPNVGAEPDVSQLGGKALPLSA